MLRLPRKRTRAWDYVVKSKALAYCFNRCVVTAELQVGGTAGKLKEADG
jgi:hypothetical protein